MAVNPFARCLSFLSILFLSTCVFSTPSVHGQTPVASEQRSGSELPVGLTRRLKLSTAAGVASLGMGLAISLHINEVQRRPVIGSPPGLDRFFRDRLRNTSRSNNFLNRHGSLYTVSGSLTAMILMQHLLADTPVWLHAAYETAVFGVGLMTELGLRITVKSTFARRRPLLEFADATTVETRRLRANNHQSFYSGHASTAFYTAAYADQYIGDLLKTRNAPRFYRGLSILSFYGWAVYSAYSRIEIDKHYFTDVLTGGLVGSAWGIWHYRFHHSAPGRWTVLPAFGGDYAGFMITRSY